MIRIFPQGTASDTPDAAVRPPVWIDLLDPTPDEVAQAEAHCGLRIPTREQLSEIESSSRVSSENGALYLSAPLVAHPEADVSQLSPVGFILTPEKLVTVRWFAFRTFSRLEDEFAKSPDACSAEAFTRLIEAIVDREADLLEAARDELDRISALIFREGETSRVRKAQMNTLLRATLQRVGRMGDQISRIRDSLVVLQRVTGYVTETAKGWMPEAFAVRLLAAKADLVSISDYEGHLQGKVQFLLDAVLGLINNEQNDIIKVLTVVSVVGVPPTLVASLYGMNFKIMPELNWTYGYPYALGLIVLTTVLPLAWFKWRGWL